MVRADTRMAVEADGFDDLLQLVDDDPAAALARTQALLAELDPPWRGAVVLRVRGLAQLRTGSLDESLATLQEASRLAADHPNPAVRGGVEMSRGAVLAFAGHTDEGLATIDTAVALLTGPGRARALTQRAMIKARAADLDGALEDYDAALPELVAAGDKVWLARLHVNRGPSYVYMGRVREALADLERARSMLEELGHAQSMALTTQSLGWVAVRGGDLPLALRYLDEAEAEFTRLGVDTGTVLLNRAEAYLAAHLPGDAMRTAARATTVLGERGDGASQAEALVVLAEAALVDGDGVVAHDAAVRARKLFGEQGRSGWEALASHLVIRATQQIDGSTVDLAAARKVADDLAVAGLEEGALHARLACVRIAVDQGDLAAGGTDLVVADRARSSPSPRLRVHYWLAAAELRRASGDDAGASRAVLTGLRVAERHRSALGATEARTGVARATADLATIGLELALRSGRPRRMLAWMERTRARALEFSPVQPPDDAALAGELGRLRELQAQMRRSELNGEAVGAKRRSVAESQIRVRRLVLASAGSERRTTTTPDPAALVGALGSGGALVELAQSDGELHAVTVVNGRVRRHFLGGSAEVEEALDSLRFALGRLAVPGRSTASLGAAAAAADDSLANLSRALILPLQLDGVRSLVIVPTPELHAVPWALLPELRGLPVIVAPSARLWLDRTSGDGEGDGAVVVAHGPDLPAAAGETRRIAALYPDALRFTVRTSRVDAVLEALDGARLAHLVAHGSFRGDNPLFSSLRLGDGPLTVYDMERVGALPPVVVLSACNSGIQAVRPGNETMGIVAGLLGAGVRTVIASTGLVADTSRTAATMVELHRRLVAGERPARALAGAQASALATGPDGLVAAPFVCFGAG